MKWNKIPLQFYTGCHRLPQNDPAYDRIQVWVNSEQLRNIILLVYTIKIIMGRVKLYKTVPKKIKPKPLTPRVALMQYNHIRQLIKS